MLRRPAERHPSAGQRRTAGVRQTGPVVALDIIGPVAEPDITGPAVALDTIGPVAAPDITGPLVAAWGSVLHPATWVTSSTCRPRAEPAVSPAIAHRSCPRTGLEALRVLAAWAVLAGPEELVESEVSVNPAVLAG
jgi:hypothetical protein